MRAGLTKILRSPDSDVESPPKVRCNRTQQKTPENSDCNIPAIQGRNRIWLNHCGGYYRHLRSRAHLLVSGLKIFDILHHCLPQTICQTSGVVGVREFSRYAYQHCARLRSRRNGIRHLFSRQLET